MREKSSVVSLFLTRAGFERRAKCPEMGVIAGMGGVANARVKFGKLAVKWPKKPCSRPGRRAESVTSERWCRPGDFYSKVSAQFFVCIRLTTLPVARSDG
jgi:hypothetical protein